MPDLWTAIRADLARQLGDSAFPSHLTTLESVSVEDGVLTLVTGDEMAALIVEKNYRGILEQCATNLSGAPVRVAIVFEAGRPLPPVPVPEPPAVAPAPTQQLTLFGGASPASAPRPKRAPASPPLATAQAPVARAAFDARGTTAPPRTIDEALLASGLTPTSRFETFVVGKSNEFAHEASRAVVEHPGTLYSPLFLYGGVGLGKTHLMHAVGHASLQRNPELRVRYLSAETFVNDLIASIGSNGMTAFRRRYREGIDLLLIDDIQFIAGKERTQEEFFHTFNALYQSGRQIILTSDRMPQELSQLEERLVSRLTMGLIVDIQPPDYETRIAILRRLAAKMRVEVPAEVTEYIAQTIRANVRELHGALLRIGSYASLRNVPVTLELTRDQLDRVHRERARMVTPEAVMRHTAEAYNLAVKDLKGRRRVATVATPRKVAMYLARKHTGASFPELGQAFGGRDHTTVMHAVKSVENALRDGDPMQHRLEAIERKLLGR